MRIVARRADTITDFGDARLWSETTRVEGRLNKKGRAVASRSKTGRGADHRSDLPAGPAGETAEAAGPRAGCGAGA